MYEGFDQLVLEKTEELIEEENLNSEQATIVVNGDLDEKTLEYGVRDEEEEWIVASYEEMTHLTENQVLDVYRAVTEAFDQNFEEYQDNFTAAS